MSAPEHQSTYPGSSTGNDLIAHLRDGLGRVGEPLIGCCLQQAMSNVLLARDIDNPDSVIGTSWGARVEKDPPKLLPGGDWTQSVEELTSLSVARLRFDRETEALEAERACLATGNPVIVEIGPTSASASGAQPNAARAVILVLATPTSVTILDPAAEPSELTLDLEHYLRARGSDSVDGFNMLVTQGVSRAPSNLDCLSLLMAHLDADEQQTIEAFGQYLEMLDRRDARFDLQAVAAERFYVGRLLRTVAEGDERWDEVARRVEGLARRWYFVQGLSMATGPGVTLDPERQGALLQELVARDQAERRIVIEASQVLASG